MLKPPLGFDGGSDLRPGIPKRPILQPLRKRDFLCFTPGSGHRIPLLWKNRECLSLNETSQATARLHG